MSDRAAVLTSGAMVDALWELGWQRRAALVLGDSFSHGLHGQTLVFDPLEWKLDVRRLSKGGALVALHQWLARLLRITLREEIRTNNAETGAAVDDYESSRYAQIAFDLASIEVFLPLIPGQMPNPSNSKFDGRVRAANKLQRTTKSPTLQDKENLQPQNEGVAEAGVEQQGHADTDSSRNGNSIRGGRHPAVIFPPTFNLVVGWGRHSKSAREPQVRAAVHRKVMQLKLPVVPVKSNFTHWGRLEGSGEALKRWLQRPGVAQRIRLTDKPIIGV